MKIIAKTDNGFLLEASRNEIAQLMGFKDGWDKGFDKEWKSDVLGNLNKQFDIDKVVETANYVRTLDRQTLLNTQHRFERLAKEVEDVRNEVSKLNLFDTLKEETE